MNAPKLYYPVRFGAVANSDVLYADFYVEEKAIIKALQLNCSADIAAGTTTAAVKVELFDRGADGTGTTLLARVTNDTTVYPAETATTKAAAITTLLGIRKDLSSRNAAVAAQGVGYEKIEGTNVLAGTHLEIVVTAGSGATIANCQVTVVYAPGQN